MADDRLEVLIFYSPECSRCKSIRKVVAEAKKSVGSFVKFIFFNVELPHVRRYIAPRYKINRIPSIVTRGEVYFVGVPETKDLVGTLSYLYVHPEGGKGVGR